MIRLSESLVMLIHPRAAWWDVMAQKNISYSGFIFSTEILFSICDENRPICYPRRGDAVICQQCSFPSERACSPLGRSGLGEHADCLCEAAVLPRSAAALRPLRHRQLLAPFLPADLALRTWPRHATERVASTELRQTQLTQITPWFF